MMTDTRPPGTHPPLRRSRNERMVAGVCGGLGRTTGLDPVIFRITLGVLAVFAGTGILIYGLAWLLIPEEDSSESAGQSLLKGRSSAQVVMAIAAAAVGVALISDVMRHGLGRTAEVLLVLGAIAAIVVLQRRGSLGRSQAEQPATAPSPAPSPGPAPEPSTADTAAYVDLGGTDWREGATTPLYDPSVTYSPEQTPVSTVPAEKRRPSALAPLTLSLALLLVGALIGLDASGAGEVAVTTVIAGVLVVLGLGLVVGGWLGRARSIIWVGAVLSFALLVTSVVDVPLRGGVGDRDWTPAVATSTPYQLAAGNMRLDLTELPRSQAGQTVKATVGLGQMLVIVPNDVDVVVKAHAGAGDLKLFGVDVNGLGPEHTMSDPANASVSMGTLRLDLRVGLGQVEVRRAQP